MTPKAGIPRDIPGDIQVGNIIWSSDNEYGIPVLRLDMQADRLDAPFVRWGRERRKSRMRGTWHFYTDDYKFARLWQRPADLIRSGCVAAAEPNFSVHAQTPKALALYATYRKRYLARSWQEVGGVRILVDLNVAWEHWRTNLVGVPIGWRSYCTRGSVDRLDVLDLEHGIARMRAASDDVLFVVYGGGKAVQARCQERQWNWTPEEADAVREVPWDAVPG
jgi:Domain of unknown function (DUF4417)